MAPPEGSALPSKFVPDWDYREFSAYKWNPRLHCSMWLRKTGNTTWVMVGAAPERYSLYYDRIFVPMIEGWRPDLSARAAEEVRFADLSGTAFRIVSFGMVPVVLVPVGLV